MQDDFYAQHRNPPKPGPAAPKNSAAPVLSILGLILAVLSILPILLGILSIPALALGIAARKRGEGRMATVAIVLSIIGLLTSPTVWALGCFIPGVDCIKDREVGEACGEKAWNRYQMTDNGASTCTLNRIEVPCSVIESYGKDDIIQCDASGNILPKSAAPTNGL